MTRVRWFLKAFKRAYRDAAHATALGISCGLLYVCLWTYGGAVLMAVIGSESFSRLILGNSMTSGKQYGSRGSPVAGFVKGALIPTMVPFALVALRWGETFWMVPVIGAMMASEPGLVRDPLSRLALLAIPPLCTLWRVIKPMVFARDSQNNPNSAPNSSSIEEVPQDGEQGANAPPGAFPADPRDFEGTTSAAVITLDPESELTVAVGEDALHENLMPQQGQSPTAAATDGGGLLGEGIEIGIGFNAAAAGNPPATQLNNITMIRTSLSSILDALCMPFVAAGTGLLLSVVLGPKRAQNPFHRALLGAAVLMSLRFVDSLFRYNRRHALLRPYPATKPPC